MLIKILKNLLRYKPAAKTDDAIDQYQTINQVQIIPTSSLNLSPDAISKEALNIIQTLQENHYQAFIVGGAVRDLILHHTPKDFDIVTNASPLEVKKLFKRSQLIGKRFPIVHVYINKQILEVSTFRRHSNDINQQGKIVKDNQYGTIHDDAERRDFTCNALYLDPIQQTIHCYHNALTHLEQKRLIMIGEADVRLKEDPIRILRAVRIAAKADLTIDESLEKSIENHGHLLTNEPLPRLFDEWVKTIYCKRSFHCFQLLRQYKLLPFIHPITQIIDEYTSPNDQQLIANTLKQTDTRLKNNQSISLGFVIAALLWPLVNQQWQHYKNKGMKPARALHEATITVITKCRYTLGIQHKNLISMNEIWRMQYRLENAKSNPQIKKLFNNPRFRAGYDFLLLRAQSNEVPSYKTEWWSKVISKVQPPSIPSHHHDHS